MILQREKSSLIKNDELVCIHMKMIKFTGTKKNEGEACNKNLLKRESKISI